MIEDTFKDVNKNKIFLNIGGVVFCKGNVEVTTVLGSCISIVLFSRSTKVSAICHAQLPEKNGKDRCSDHCSVRCMKHLSESADNKYVNCALKKMISWFEKRGMHSTQLEAKIYGGAHVINVNSIGGTVGELNVRRALELLRENNIQIVEKDVYGEKGRKIVFQNGSMEVKVTNPNVKLIEDYKNAQVRENNALLN